MEKSTKIFEKKVKKEFYFLVNELTLFNARRFVIPFNSLRIDFYYNDKTTITALYNYSAFCIYINTFYQNKVNIRQVLIHEITHFLIFCSFNHSKNLFAINDTYRLHSKHTLLFSIYCDLLSLVFKDCNHDKLLDTYNYHEDPDFENLKLYLNKNDYINTLINFGSKVNDYFDLFLISIYIYNVLKIGEIVPLNHYQFNLSVIEIY